MNDLERIQALGGVDAIAKYLDFTNQRVFNWTKRGIPAKVKVDYPELFQSKNPPILTPQTPTDE